MYAYMIETWKAYKEIIIDMKYSIKSFIKYQLIGKALVSIFLLPLFLLSIEFLMKSRGFLNLTNSQLIKFIFSFEGFFSLILVFVLSGLVILIEMGGMIIISHQVYTKQPESRFYAIFKFCLKKFKNLMGTGGVLMSLYLCMIAPWLHIGLKTSLISSFKIPGFIQDYIHQNLLFSGVYYILMIILIIISIQWIFSLHIVMIENKSATQALKESSKLVKNNWRLLLKKFIGIFCMNIFFLLSIFCMVVLIIFVLDCFINLDTSFDNIIFTMLIGFLICIGFLSSFIIIPFQVHHFTILYYTVAYKEQNKTMDRIILEKKDQSISLVDRLLKYKKTWTFFGVGVFIIAVCMTGLVFHEAMHVKYDVQITAHRGSSTEAPENTLAAINVAILHGADFAEIDVQETQDGEIVLLHDQSLKRITGVDKNIWEINYAEIKNLDGGSWFDEKFKGEKIPTLKEVIDFSKDKIKLNIEIKKSSYSKNLVASVVKIIEEKGIEDDCVVTSLDYDVLLEVEKLNSRIETGYIMFVALGDLSNLKADFYSVEASNVNEDFIDTAHMMGKKVHVWTINEEEDMTEMMGLGVDNIITDYDEVLRKIIKEDKEQ